MLCYAVLSGPDTDLSRDELSAVLESYGLPPEVVVHGRLAIFKAGDKLSELSFRLAFTLETGRVLGLPDGLDDVHPEKYAEEFEGVSFKVDSEGFGSKEKARLDALIGKLLLQAARGSSVRMSKPKKVLRLIREDGFLMLGVRESLVRGRWKGRRPRARPFFHPVAIFPKLSRLMVNLTRVSSCDVLLDPCAGTGSLLLEAADMGVEVMGLDVSKKMVFGCRRNLVAYAAGEHHEALADARFLPVRSVSAIATDVPYGRASSVVGSSTPRLAEEILREGARVLPTGSYLVMMTSSESVPAGSEKLKMVSSHDLYVHRSLTRTLTVYRKV